MKADENAGPMTALRLTVHGRVQGVFYRDWTIRNARELGLAGWVRNEADGTVAAHLEGDAEAVEAMVARMHDGPPHAAPTRIERRAVEPEGLVTFERG
jgi:acylphosphatase